MERVTDLIIYLALFIVSLVILAIVAVVIISFVVGMVQSAVDKVRKKKRRDCEGEAGYEQIH